MARTVLGQETLAKNSSATAGTGTALAVGGSGYYIAAGAGVPENLLLTVAFTGATGTVTVKAGANPPAVTSGAGDLTITGYNQTRYIRIYESARFLQADGSINIDFSGAAATGTATVWKTGNA
jgi:hypothetical protein